MCVACRATWNPNGEILTCPKARVVGMSHQLVPQVALTRTKWPSDQTFVLVWLTQSWSLFHLKTCTFLVFLVTSTLSTCARKFHEIVKSPHWCSQCWFATSSWQLTKVCRDLSGCCQTVTDQKWGLAVYSQMQA